MKLKVAILSSTALSLAVGFANVAQAADVTDPIYVPDPPAQGRTISGTVSLWGAYGDRTNDQGGVGSWVVNPWYLGGDARVDIPISDMFSLQLDQYGQFMTDQGTTSEDFTGGYMTGAHINWRDPERYLFGVFGGVGKIHSASTSDDEYRSWMLGVEGQYHFGNATLYGQAGYLDGDSNATSENWITDAYFVRGVARYYFNNGATKLEGELAYASGDQDSHPSDAPTVNLDMVAWGAEIEHAFHSFGNDGFISGFARYQGQDYDEGGVGGNDATIHTFMVGIKVDLNQPNPMNRDRYGAGVNLPSMDWAASSRLVD